MSIFNSLNVVLLEGNIISANKKENILSLERIFLTMPKGTDLVILPELFSTGKITNIDDLRDLSEKNTGNTIQTLFQLAKQYNLAIAGSFIAKTSNKIFNRAFFIEASGDEYFYDQKHNLDINSKNELYSKGYKLPQIIRYRGWNIMLCVGLDIRFPVWLRNINKKYDLLINVTNTPRTETYKWQHLLIARALENQCYVCGVNRIGIDKNDIEYIGESIIIDYDGNIIAKRDNDSPIIGYTIGKQELELHRKRNPFWNETDEFNL